MKLCADLFAVPPADLLSRKRDGGMTEARFALYKALHLRGLSYSAIGAFLRRHHTSVMHGVRIANKLMRDQPAYAERVQRVAAWQPKKLTTGETTNV